ncbi:hypothetical protein PINS_up008275 [Pythium insidiosum]|nr:hypothetical protein PINS_up008275 [Pythium insidiosum]
MRIVASSLLVLALCQAIVFAQDEETDTGDIGMNVNGEEDIPVIANAMANSSSPGMPASRPPMMQPNRTGGSGADAGIVKRVSGSTTGSKSIDLPSAAGSVDNTDEDIATKKPSSSVMGPSRSTNSSSPSPTTTPKSGASSVSSSSVSAVLTMATSAAVIHVWRC